MTRYSRRSGRRLRAQTDFAASPSTGVTGGIEWLGERARSTYITGEQGQQVPVERRMLGIFGEVRQELGHVASSLTAGLRVERIHRDALEAIRTRSRRVRRSPTTR